MVGLRQTAALTFVSDMGSNCQAQVAPTTLPHGSPEHYAARVLTLWHAQASEWARARRETTASDSLHGQLQMETQTDAPSAFRIGQAGRNGLAAPEGPEPHPPDAGSDYPALLFQWRLRARAGDVDVRHGRALGDASSRLVASTPHTNRIGPLVLGIPDSATDDSGDIKPLCHPPVTASVEH